MPCKVIHDRHKASYPQHRRGDRGTPYGNPHGVGRASCPICHRRHRREEAIALFRELCYSATYEPIRLRALRELSGDSVIVCWCKPFPCHLDVVAEYVNMMAPLVAVSPI